jgi:hypothetical protein
MIIGVGGGQAMMTRKHTARAAGVVSTAVSAVVPNRRPRIEGDREAEILDAAVRVLADVGYDRLTMDMVASEARASKATLYRRWQNKAALVVDPSRGPKASRRPTCPAPARCGATCSRPGVAAKAEVRLCRCR